MRLTGIERSSRLMVRSSGIDESIELRGALDSLEATAMTVAQQVTLLEARLVGLELKHRSAVHWVVQELITVQAKGHLSNERRVAEDKRDWVAEVEASETHPVESHRISLRTWRDRRPPHDASLHCAYRERYLECLEVVAKWAYDRLVRVHFEWVWDGRTVHVVQADACDTVRGGVEPRSLVAEALPHAPAPAALRVFRVATDDDFGRYRKLANAKLYRDLGYSMVSFYVLDNAEEFRKLLDEGVCSDLLRADLECLVARPTVIRTDGQKIPTELRQMLPRSEELRSLNAAVQWLTAEFRQTCNQVDSDGRTLASGELCLIAHHFVPAAAAAWCQARPEHRRVRIESLWGIPEGLYWHAYDVFDVDTQVLNLLEPTSRPKDIAIREKRRYKEHFIAPNAEGRWVLHRSAAGPDWQRSITKADWIEEIAWTSRRIAARAGYPVVVMWFVDVADGATKHRVLPWYHEEWKADSSPHKAAPRRKLSGSSDFVLKDRADWEGLKARVASGGSVVRVRVQPTEPELVRNQEFANELGAFAKQHKLVIELEGGILSHAYYMLSRSGCSVECADLDDYATDDYELEFNKLVRDGIPEAIASRGEAVTVYRLAGEALIAALRRKLVEESLEVLDSRTTDEIAEELADVREVSLSLMARLEIAESDVEARRKRKLKRRGGFSNALMLSRTAIAPSTGIDRDPVDHATGLHQFVAGTLDRAAAMPEAQESVHVDRRHDAGGAAERQFTVDLPAHASGLRPMRVAFSLPTMSGESHDMVLDLFVDRRASELRVRARLANNAKQLELDLRARQDDELEAGRGER